MKYLFIGLFRSSMSAKRILLASMCLLGPFVSLLGQYNDEGIEIYRPDYDKQLYYFGATIGYNSTFLHPIKSSRFIQDDSILSAVPGASGGLNVGLSATLRLSRHFQLRFNPQFIIGGSKTFTYQLGLLASGYDSSYTIVKTLPSTIVSLPFQIKLNSDRIDNFRAYVMTGVKFDYDLSATSSERNTEDMIKLKGADFGLEFGIGCNFFLPFVTVSPEIKFDYGFYNLLSRDPNLKYSAVFDGIYSRAIIFSIHFED